MVPKALWYAFIAGLLFCVSGTTATKCTQCSYNNNFERCQRTDCEGSWCFISVQIDIKANTALVNKSCLDSDSDLAFSRVMPVGNAEGVRQCLNYTKQDVERIICVCNTDRCTDSFDSDIDFVRHLILAQQAAPSGVTTGNGENGGGTTAPTSTLAASSTHQVDTATEDSIGSSQEAPALPTNQTSSGDQNQTVAILGGPMEPLPEVPASTEAGTTAGSVEATPATEGGEGSTPEGHDEGTEGTEGTEGPTEGTQAATEGTTPNAVAEASSTAGSTAGGTEGTPAGSTTETNEGEEPTTEGTHAPSSTEAPTGTTVGGTESAGTEGTEGTPAAESTVGGTESSPPAESTEGTPPAPATEAGASGSTAGAPVTSPTDNGRADLGTTATPSAAAIQEAPATQVNLPPVNISVGLGDLHNVVNERVHFFSAVSLQRLPPYLAGSTVLTPDKQHYDVLTNRIDGDMSFNQAQLDDLIESERIYLPPKPVHESESSSSLEPFNGVLIGRDLEQVNAWPQLQPILYAFKPSVDPATRAVIRQAFSLWENNTCVSFSEITSTSPDQYVLEIDSQPAPADAISCGVSTVGRWPKVKLQVWKAGPSQRGCATTGTIAHAVGHVLGLWHTQNRFDAYDYVFVPADVNGNIDVHAQSASQANYDVGYDYGSIMHFGDDILRPKDPRYTQTIGQMREPSFIDYKTVNLQQRCIDLCPPSNCFVGGYTTPPDCTKCHCPTGFGGNRCETFRPSVGDCGKQVGSIFAGDDWKELSITFTGNKGPDRENQCFWHIWGKNGSQVELEVVNVSLHFSPAGCVDAKTGERNFIEIKVGDNDADKSFDFQRTGFRLCELDPAVLTADRPIISTNRLIVLAAYVGQAGSFTVRYRNAGGGNPGLAAALRGSGLASPVRPGVRVSGSENSTAALLFEAGEEARVGKNVNPAEKCDVRRSLVPGDRLASPCRVIRSFYGRYTYIFTRRGRHRIFYNDRYFEPRILIYDARQTPPLKNGVLVNDKSGVLRIEDDGGATYDPFPYYLSTDRQKALGPLKLVVTEDGRLVARSANGTEVTLVCLSHFACVRLHRRLQGFHETSNDTRVMLQGGILYSESRLYFATLSSRGEFAVRQRTKATDPLSTAGAKVVWVFGPTPKGRTGQPYRLLIERNGTPSIRDGDDEVVWRVNATITKDQLPTVLSLSDKGKLTLQDSHGKVVWTN